MFKIEKVTDDKGRVLIQDPPIARFFFQSTMMAWLWLVVRVYVGYDFLTAVLLAQVHHSGVDERLGGGGHPRILEGRSQQHTVRCVSHYV